VAKLRRQQRGVELLTAGGPTIFDHVVVATHSDQALALLGDPTPEERRVLGAFRYQPNRATLHTDTTLLPANRRAWASWNYVRPLGTPDGATLTYYLNRLQALPSEQPVLVTLNRDEAIDPRHVVARFDYEHPIVDQDAVDAQSDQRALSAGTVSYCGAYWGFGFHEDGVRSALAVCERFGAKL
jgi:predicted NAD/FAD-binding protein